jgi:ABC-type long-subunit fatty acid transport system fused permease/ATPase subunit
MLEKVGAAVTIIVSFVALWTIQMMDLPIFLAIPLVFAAVIICLVGIVFLFAEGSILKEHRRQKALKADYKTAPKIEAAAS